MVKIDRKYYVEESGNVELGELLPMLQKRMVGATSYFGVKTMKNPLDFWVYQEMIFKMKPDYILEVGNNWGGSTLALAHLLDSIGKGSIIGLDIDHSKVPKIVTNHPRITLIEDDACASYDKVRSMIPEGARTLVIEDSSHTYENTLAVLRQYNEFVLPGDYFIVEDSIVYHGLYGTEGKGPYESIETFVSENKSFEIDRNKESFIVTWNPKGFLKRIA
jgi:cephalosporin hydroxylase